MMAERVRGELYRTIRLCIDSYDQGVMTGRFYHPSLKDGCCVFQSLVQLLLQIEQLLDSINYPQAYTAKRTFAPTSDVHLHGGDPGQSRTGQKATFQIRLMFRQHASWQGSVTWIEGKGEQTFRSVLELVLLMDSALGGCLEGEEEA